MSSQHNDPERLTKWHLSKEQQDHQVERFKAAGDPLSILIVCDMLLTGFDAPIEQVMYLDSPLREHTLLQAIARVNRPCGEEKTYGLVVDYWGVSDALQEALAIFSSEDIKGALAGCGKRYLEPLCAEGDPHKHWAFRLSVHRKPQFAGVFPHPASVLSPWFAP
jgi:type I site-specific restriction-modification system R (restriction) subunit